MQSAAMLLGLTLLLFVAVYWGATHALRRARDKERASRLLVVAAVAFGVFLALRGAGGDPIPSYLIGEMIGSSAVFLLPVVIAIVRERRRQRALTQ